MTLVSQNGGVKGFLCKLPNYFQAIFQKKKKLFCNFLLTNRAKSDIILLLLKYAPVAQLDRVSGYEPEGRGFESLLAYQQRDVASKFALSVC